MFRSLSTFKSSRIHSLSYSFSTTASKPPGMLDGVRVLDLSRILAGPYGTMLLADMGAEVIKVEPPEGDETRRWGPPFIGSDATYYFSINRNKKGLCLDLKKKQGLDVLYKLVEKSDILVENFAPGVTDRLKIDYDTLSKINPGLVYASLTAYGTTGPWASKPGFDMINQAMSGLLHVTGHRDGPPAKVGVAVTDIISGLTLNNGILAALYEKKVTGKGKRIETSLMESMLSGLVNLWSAHLNGGADPQRHGNQHPSIAPSGIYQTIEGKYISIFCNDKQFLALCEAIGLEGLMTDEKFNTNKARVGNMKELDKILQETIKKLNFDVVIKKLEEKRVPSGPVNSIKDVFESEHIKALEIVKKVESENYGELKLVRNPIRVDGEQFGDISPPPAIGEHGDEILKEILGFTKEEISALRQGKVIP